MTTASSRRPEDQDEPLTNEPDDLQEPALTPASTELVSDDLEVPGPAPVLGEGEPVDALPDPVTGAAPQAGEDGDPEASEPGHRAARHAAPQDDDPSSTVVRRRSLFSREEEAAERQAAQAAQPQHPAEATASLAPPTSASTPQETSNDADLADEDDDAPLTPAWPQRTPESRSEEDILLDGSVVVGRPASRAAAHWAGVLLSLVLLPPAWFLLHDAAAHLVQATESYHFALTTRGAVELVVGCLLLVTALWTARRSSLGTFVVGTLTLVAGLPGLVAPGPVDRVVAPFLARLAEQSSLGEDVATMLWSDAVSGRFLALGLALVMIGVVSHSARRAGRREQEVIDRVRHVG
ncbi:hypothetical protein [Actinomyces faecalis]|uniref:hypothetical protein n=1 Tax=Actinomyces faecalis TaxID=2722820 RepID=UPI0015581853|nr:hypothetical protein [Actinomyces faecalis]